MEVVVPSIRHTGTWFTIGLFTSLGMREAGINERRSDNTVYHCHLDKETQVKPAIELSRHMPCVVPMRHPYRVEESWRHHYEGTDITIDMMCACYRTVVNRLSHAILLPVDSDQRQRYLDAINAALNMDLQTDWTPVNSKARTWDKPLTDFIPSDQVRALIDDITPIMRTYET